MPLLTLLFALTVGLLVPAAEGRAATGLHSETEGPLYRISAIELSYARAHPAHPPAEQLLAVQYALGRSDDGLVGPRIGGENRWFALGDLPGRPSEEPIALYASGLRELNEQIVEELNARGLIGVYVAPHDEDVDPDTGRDLRQDESGPLRLVIYTGRVEALRSFAAGADAESEVNAREHARIRTGSPAQAGSDRDTGSLLRKPELDAYLAYLNRHPARRVDLTVTPTREPGGVYLDYVIAEARPWLAYLQASNTGTDSTGHGRQRLGFSHFQVSGRDDVLSVDYVTGDFDQVHAGRASYELPVYGLSRTRLGLELAGSRYEASQLGFGDDAFSGRQWSIATRVAFTLLQREDWFLDLRAGARWLDIEVENLGNRGDGDFLLPTLGLGVERRTDVSSFRFDLDYERSVGGSSSESELFRLGGRANLDDEWSLLRFDGELSFYLEPLLWGRAWRNPRTPASSTTAHELAFRLRGQLAFGHRLIPHAQQTLGGFYSVRGYDQSVVAGDGVWAASAEYRLHLPRLLAIDSEPRELPVLGTFRVAPQRVYGRPDWDLILRLFVDAGEARISDKQAGERDHELLSSGFGLELDIRRRLILRYDLGYALRDVEVGSTTRAESGDTEHHVSATVRY